MSTLSSTWTVPDTWTWVLIGDVAHVVGGGTPRTTEASNFEHGTVPWVTPADLSGYTDRYIGRGSRNITTSGLKCSGARLLPKGTVLFSSRAPIGYVAIASNPLATNQGFKSFVLPPGLDPEYVYYYLQRAKELAIGLASGTTFQEVSGRQAAKIPLAIAPLPEQHRIVEAIESYVTRLDDAVATLERVQRNLKRYRASVLKAAVEGRLVPTEAELARAEGRDYEPASVLLERILAERRRRWEEAELAKMQAKGKPPKDDKWKAKYKEPVSPAADPLPELPEGWCWATWSQIGFSQNGRAFPSKEYAEHGVPLLRPGNLHVSGRVAWNHTNTRCMPAKWEQGFPGFVVGPDELVMNLTAQSLKDEFLGRVCMTGIDEYCLLNQRIARLTPIGVRSRFVLWWLKTPLFRTFVDRLNTGSLIQHMFTSQLDTFAFPLPPLAEQERIVVEIDRHVSAVDAVDGDIQRNKLRASKLRQSVLRWAFEARLVDQDPTDEPASRLLERIQAEREAKPAQPSRTRRSARAAKDRT